MKNSIKQILACKMRNTYGKPALIGGTVFIDRHRRPEFLPMNLAKRPYAAPPVLEINGYGKQHVVI